MNEMRKLMETVSELDEVDARRPSRHEKRHPAEVLQYFSNKREGGRIKPGYKAFDVFDGEDREVTSISVGQGESGREYYMSGPGAGGWRTLSLDRVKVYRLEQVL